MIITMHFKATVKDRAFVNLLKILEDPTKKSNLSNNENSKFVSPNCKCYNCI